MLGLASPPIHKHVKYLESQLSTVQQQQLINITFAPYNQSRAEVFNRDNMISSTRRIKSISIPAVPLMINHEASQKLSPHKEISGEIVIPEKLYSNNLESQNEIIYEPNLAISESKR